MQTKTNPGKSSWRCVFAVSAAIALSSVPVRALTVWNVNIGPQTLTDFQGAAPENGLPTYWNPVTGTPTAATDMPLVDSTNAASTVTLAINCVNSTGGAIAVRQPNPAQVSGDLIFRHYFGGTGITTTATLKGLTVGKTYAMVVYGDWYWGATNSPNGLPVTQTTGSGLAGTIYLNRPNRTAAQNGQIPPLDEDTDPTDGSADQGNWLRINGLTPDASGHLGFTFGINSSSMNQGMSGFQLIDTTADESDVTPPAPNPMTWATVPAAVDESAITMKATTATDPNGVEYLFTESSGYPGATSSGWQNSPTYTDTGLTPGTSYTYTVTARDKSAAQNQTAATAPASVATLPADLTPPPVPTFAVGPLYTNIGAITMHATVVLDPEGHGVQYYFAETSGHPGASDSGWQSSPEYTDTGLTPGTAYTYTVKSRDNSLASNVSAASDPATAVTPDAAVGEVAWASAQNITGPLDVVTTGTLVTSRRGDDTSDPIIVNGVDFAPGRVIANGGFADGLCPDTGAGAENEALEFLLDRISWNGDSFEITGLTPGSKYLIQLFLCDYRVPDRRMSLTGPGASSTVTLSSNPPGAFGQTAVGTFIAAGATQTIGISALSGGSTHLNSYQVRLIAEPAAPRITAFTPAGGGLWNVTLTGLPNTAYEFRASPDLNFLPATRVINLIQANPAEDPGDISGLENHLLTTDASGVGVARVALSGLRQFIRGQAAVLP